MRKIRGLLVLTLSCFGFLLTPLWAAIQAMSGNQSFNTLNVSADFAGTALINNLTDMAFTSVLPVIAQTQKENVCVFANSILGGSYSITATGSGAGNAFTVTNGTSVVAYTVNWAATTNATSGTQLTSGVPLTGQNTGIITSICILGTTDATLFVSFSLSALQNAAAGSFSGILTLVVTPT